MALRCRTLVLLIALLMALLFMALSGCMTTTGRGSARGPLAGVESWLTPDFAVDNFARRADRLARVGPGFVTEAARTERMAKAPAKLVEHEAKGFADMPGQLSNIANTELRRRPHLKSMAPMGTPDDVARRLAADLANLPALLGLERRPLGEHDDREHRTDPHDNRPEKTFGERLLRRLGL